MNSKKKVLFLVTKATWGGAQRYVFDLVMNLPHGEYSAALAFGERGSLSAELEGSGIPTHWIPAMGREISFISDIASFFEIVTLLRQTKPTVLHVNSSKAGGLGALAGRAARVPRIVFTAHGWPFKEERAKAIRIAMYLASWLTVLLSHATIVVSERDLEIGRRMPLVGRKVRYVPLAIAAPAFLAREDAWREIRRLSSVENPSLPRVVTIAELTPNKGIRHALDAIRELADRNIACNYFLIGAGTEREELETHAIEREIDTRVFFLGFLPNASRLLKAFDVFLSPSIKEGMPYVLLEAASAGVPIVATEVIDASFAAAAGAIRVPPARPALLADALARALEAPARGAPNPHEGSLANMLDQTLALYRR